MAVTSIFTGPGHLYLICDGETCERHGIQPGDFVRAATGAGAKILQYRHKGISPQQYEANLQQLLAHCEESTLIINDHAEIAARYHLPLHLGQADPLPRELPVPYGRSTHSLAELNYALGCNPAPVYVALGTMFASGTKPNVATNRSLISEYRAHTSLPLVLIGGITLDNVRELPRAENIYYAVIGDAFRYGATLNGIAEFVRHFAHE